MVGMVNSKSHISMRILFKQKAGMSAAKILLKPAHFDFSILRVVVFLPVYKCITKGEIAVYIEFFILIASACIFMVIHIRNHQFIGVSINTPASIEPVQFSAKNRIQIFINYQISVTRDHFFTLFCYRIIDLYILTVVSVQIFFSPRASKDHSAVIMIA